MGSYVLAQPSASASRSNTEMDRNELGKWGVTLGSGVP